MGRKIESEERGEMGDGELTRIGSDLGSYRGRETDEGCREGLE